MYSEKALLHEEEHRLCKAHNRGAILVSLKEVSYMAQETTGSPSQPFSSSYSHDLSTEGWWWWFFYVTFLFPISTSYLAVST